MIRRTPGRHRRVKTSLAAALALCCAASAVRSAPPVDRPGRQPPASSLWLIDTRGVSGCDPATEGGPEYWRCGPDRQWTAAQLKDFLDADDPAVPTVFFLHGNRVGADDAVDLGCEVYAILKAEAESRPLRFVIWSWPSDRVAGRVRRDVQVKAARSDVESNYLADCVRRIDPKVRISLIGYSFGARTIGGALHLLSGPEREGSRAAKPASGRAAVRVVLFAAAMDNTSLLPGCANGSALKSVERALVTCNPADPALRWYRRMDRGRGPDALGFTGPACLSQLGPDAEKLEVLNLSCEVGRRHESQCYLAACSLRSRLGWYAFLDRPEPSPETTARQAVGSATRAQLAPLMRAAVHVAPLSALLAQSAPGRSAVRPQQ